MKRGVSPAQVGVVGRESGRERAVGEVRGEGKRGKGKSYDFLEDGLDMGRGEEGVHARSQASGDAGLEPSIDQGETRHSGI